MPPPTEYNHDRCQSPNEVFLPQPPLHNLLNVAIKGPVTSQTVLTGLRISTAPRFLCGLCGADEECENVKQGHLVGIDYAEDAADSAT